jgi:hypothetical protein
LQKYGWLEHDGVNFGVQELKDGPINLKTSFVKRSHETGPGEWSARIEATSLTEVRRLFRVTKKRNIIAELTNVSLLLQE